MNDIHQEQGALQMPRLFRRSTGVHAILVGVLGADLAETILLILIGGFADPPLQWLGQTAFLWLHTSLLGDIALVLVLTLFAFAFIAKVIGKATNADSWGCAAVCSIPILSIFLILWLVQPDWIAIHASVIPVRAQEPFPWPLVFVAPGGWMAFALSLFAHLLVWRGYQQAKTTRQHTFSRAHQDGDAWGTIESAYSIVVGSWHAMIRCRSLCTYPQRFSTIPLMPPWKMRNARSTGMTTIWFCRPT